MFKPYKSKGYEMKYLFVFTAFFLILSQNTDAGLVMEQERYESESSIRQKGKVYLQDNIFKFHDTAQDVATVFNLDKGQMMYINYGDKTYTVTTPEELVKFFKEIQEKIDKQVKEDLAKLPPEQRAKVEKEMKNKGFLSDNSGPVKIQIKDTGRSDNISGYSCKYFEIYKNDKLDEELCLSNDLEYRDEINIRKLSSFMNDFKKIGKNLGNDIVIDNEQDFLQLFENNGYPLKTTDHSVNGSVFIEEIKSVTKKELKKDEFFPPKGYEYKSLESVLAPAFE